MKRGDVYIANLIPRSGSEQRGKRPVIIVSHDGFNQTPGWRSIIVVPVSTSDVQGKRGPTAIWLDKEVGGLRRRSVALCHQVTTLDRSKLTQKLGVLSKDSLRQVDAGLLAALDLYPWESGA